MRLPLASLLLLPVLSFAPAALAQGANPCGNFDFSAGIDCRIEVEGGCTAQCTPLHLEAGCEGQCTATAEVACVDDCGAACVAMCDPSLLDCYAGCREECDQPLIAKCEQQKPGEDCVSIVASECNMHCTEACEVPPSDCEEHCNNCCLGSCTADVNFECNFNCFATLEGKCEAQCDAPSGALFCNGQYVNASDIEACISYLATQGVDVDVSARGSLSCGLDGCEGSSDSSLGCSAAPGASASGVSGIFAALGLAGLAGFFAARRRRRG